MTPAEALSLLNQGDPDGLVPPLYRHMDPLLLRTLVQEIGPPAPPPVTVQDLLQRAIAKPRRLRTMARRRVAFLWHFANCRTLSQAAARAGVDRRTINRWRTASTVFDGRIVQLRVDRREDAFEQALLIASQPLIKPVFYKGQKVGEYEIPNTPLALYLLRRADAEADREVRREERLQKAKAEAADEPNPWNTETREEAMERVRLMRSGEWFKDEPAAGTRPDVPRDERMSHLRGIEKQGVPTLASSPDRNTSPCERGGASMSHSAGHGEPEPVPTTPTPSNGLPWPVGARFF
jgi:hypothetical protein